MFTCTAPLSLAYLSGYSASLKKATAFDGAYFVKEPPFVSV